MATIPDGSFATSFLAIWGAGLSTFLFVRTIYKDFRDRGNVRVEAYLYEFDEIDEETKEQVRRYEVEIILTNAGLRPIVVHSIGTGSQQGALLYLWRRLPPFIRLHRNAPKGFYEAILINDGYLPKRLDPGDFISFRRQNLVFLSSPNSVFFAIDSLDRYYFLPNAAWERMRTNHDPASPHASTVEHMFAKIRY